MKTSAKKGGERKSNFDKSIKKFMFETKKNEFGGVCDLRHGSNNRDWQGRRNQRHSRWVKNYFCIMITKRKKRKQDWNVEYVLHSLFGSSIWFALIRRKEKNNIWVTEVIGYRIKKRCHRHVKDWSRGRSKRVREHIGCLHWRKRWETMDFLLINLNSSVWIGG